MNKPTNNIAVTFGELAATLPRFADGRLNYTGAPRALVITAVVYADSRILLLKRSGRVGTHPHTWSAVSGFLDRAVSAADMALSECAEELGFGAAHIKRVRTGEPYENTDPVSGTVWVNVPVLIEATGQHEPTLDWEHVEHAWIAPATLSKYNLMPGMDRAISLALALNGRT